MTHTCQGKIQRYSSCSTLGWSVNAITKTSYKGNKSLRERERMLFILLSIYSFYVQQCTIIQEEATEAMVKLTCPRSTSRDIWHTRWELKPGQGVPIPQRVSLYHGPIIFILLNNKILRLDKFSFERMQITPRKKKKLRCPSDCRFSYVFG